MPAEDDCQDGIGLRTDKKTKRSNNMKKILIGVVSILAIGMSAFASPASLPAKVAVKGGEKVAVKLGLRAACEGAVRGGAKLAAVTAEREAAKRTAGEVAKEVAKHTTPKKILAAGAGTALVVAAHEGADGFQALGEGVRTAVEANPSLAVDVADRVAAPARYLAIMGGAILLLFLVWFAWPWVSVVRNWSRLAAAKRNAAMMEAGQASSVKGGGDVIDVPVVDASASARPGFTRVELVLLVAGFLVLTILGVCRMAGGCSASRGRNELGPRASSKADLKAMAAKRAEAVARMKADYVAAIDKHYANYVAEAESVAASEFGAVRDGIPAVVEKFGTFSRCKELVVTLVKDKMDDGNRTEESIRRDLEADYYRGLYKARDGVNECLVSFLRNAEAARQAFMEDLEVELDSVTLPGDDAYRAMLTDCGERIEKSKRDLAEGQITAAISVAIEAACIRFTVATVARILGKAAARMAGSAAAGVGAAAVDGPLPIGDIIGGILVIGSAAWTAYDVWQATETLPAEMKKTLRSVADDCEAQTLDEFKKAGKSICDAYCGVNDL